MTIFTFARSASARLIFVALSALVLIHFNAQAHAQSESMPTVKGIVVKSGFKATKVAGDDLATNIFCMAVSPKGETFVSGPGYIKVLIDSDADGQFDSTRTFANGPASGAQGICFDGNDLLCIGDGGLLRFADVNQDGVADGKPEVIFPIRTGGEHHAHAIRKGPDGWWYILAGNQTPILPEYYSGENSPIKQPRAGFLMRVSPDWKVKEIVVHGFRNAYDFDFNSSGQIFVYDSDGERDINLPWYRPTRLFEMRPGDDAGWVSRGWKRDCSLFDMPVEVGRFGRGSPTGVVVSSSNKFPPDYNDAVFFADWTFGRVLVCKRTADGSYDKGSDFVVADGQFGFAVTDLDFAPDGSLLISVGGRGTEGGVYRVSYAQKLEFQKAADLHSDFEFLRMSKMKRLSGKELTSGLSNSSVRLQGFALEALIGRRDVLTNVGLQDDLALGLINSMQLVEARRLGSVLRVLEGLSLATLQKVSDSSLPIESKLLCQLVLSKSESQKRELLKLVCEALARGESDPLVLARIGQLTLGGCGAENADQMFVGYTAKSPIKLESEDLELLGQDLNLALRLISQADRSRSKDKSVVEIGRFAAMLGCQSTDLVRWFAFCAEDRLGEELGFLPGGIHWLNCIAQTSTSPGDGPEASQTNMARVASLLRFQSARIHEAKPNLDRNFYPRMRALVKQLLEKDQLSATPTLADAIAASLYGYAEDVYIFGLLPAKNKATAAAKFAEQISNTPAKATAGQLSVLSSNREGAYLGLIRKFASRRDLQGAVISALSATPIAEDRELFLRGLADRNLGTVKQSAIGLRRIQGVASSEEIVAAIVTADQLAWDKPSISVRDQLMLLLQKKTSKRFGYKPKKQSEQTEVLAKWKGWGTATYPKEFAEYEKRSFKISMTPESFAARMSKIDWDAGDIKRGKSVFEKRQCAQCHDQGVRLGPRLEGLSKRFSRDDMFRSIVNPNESVPDRYRAILIETVDGNFYRGSVVYESVDGITLQEASGMTLRINQDDIESRTRSSLSLMPSGLLDEATDQDWADLFAYLKSL
ncbi:MAG: hypothetical protein AB8B55_11340 [Mariniblastus sp.]